MPFTGGTRWLTGGVNLLDADADLGTSLPDEVLSDARQHAVVPGVVLEVGPWLPHDLDDAAQISGTVRGVMLLEGSLTINVSLTGRSCTRLIMPGEILLLDGEELADLPVWWGWSVVERARVAVFDDRLLAIGRHWPALMGKILNRAAGQTKQALFQQAVSQLPRVEDRLLALLWSVAERSGVVRPDGVWVHLPVSHSALADMIGARRPTVSLGLRSLADQGLVRSEQGGWLLDRASVVELTAEPAEDFDDEPCEEAARSE